MTVNTLAIFLLITALLLQWLVYSNKKVLGCIMYIGVTKINQHQRFIKAGPALWLCAYQNNNWVPL